MTGIWNRKVEIGKEEVLMHSPSLITHQIKASDLKIEIASDSSIVRLKYEIRNVREGQNQPLLED